MLSLGLHAVAALALAWSHVTLVGANDLAGEAVLVALTLREPAPESPFDEPEREAHDEPPLEVVEDDLDVADPLVPLWGVPRAPEPLDAPAQERVLEPVVDPVGVFEPRIVTDLPPRVRPDAPDDVPYDTDEPAPALVGAAAPAETPAAVEPVVVDAPRPPYPALARRRGWEGVVLCRVRVTAAGEVAEVGVARSSGHGVLDRAATDAVARWRFRPGRRGGREAPWEVFLEVVFQLRS